NPSFARGWYFSGTLRVWAGQPDLAIEHAEVSLRLSPRARVGLPLFVIGAAHFVSRRFDLSLPKLLLEIQEHPNFAEPHRFLAACHAYRGRLDNAGGAVRRLRSITALVVPDVPPLGNAEPRELSLSGLRLAADEAK